LSIFGIRFINLAVAVVVFSVAQLRCRDNLTSTISPRAVGFAELLSFFAESFSVGPNRASVAVLLIARCALTGRSIGEPITILVDPIPADLGDFLVSGDTF
tara:strand:- start:4536 stop:4838 length:303 start_codon:yes stop_codon:yes gene_type:complete